MSTPVRLHITPLTSELLPKFLAPSVLSQASRVSFHEVQTYPENNYGYLDLPRTEAQKLKKKLDGTVFKGRKVKIEEAKPEKDLVPDMEDVQPAESGKKRTRGQKRKRDIAVIPGQELEDGRKVKRGWTKPMELRKSRSKVEASEKGKKKSKRSEYSDKEELLFKAKIPDNKRGPNKSNTGKKGKKAKAESDTTIVHEFENRTKHPSFLRATINAGASEGKADKSVQNSKASKKLSSGGSSAKSGESDKDSSSAQEQSSSSASESNESEHETPNRSRNSAKTATPTVPTIREESGSSSEAHLASPAVASEDEETSSSGSSSDSDDAELEKNESPHPLETLFKRPAAKSTKSTAATNLSIEPTPFSFFEEEDDNDASNNIASTSTEQSTPASGGGLTSRRGPKQLSLAIPATPHTAMDNQWRAQRSAAPTPDTAAPDKTEFKKWFWDNRGENNRAWKKRRREAKKEDRVRRSKRLGL